MYFIESVNSSDFIAREGSREIFFKKMLTYFAASILLVSLALAWNLNSMEQL
jgi:hypothetical protein